MPSAARPEVAVPQKFATVEAGRGVAALLVVLFHADAAMFPAAKYWHTVVFGGVFDFGYAGVDFFFVLSGFIIWTVHARDIGRPARLGSFAMRRLIRIYPPYWIVLLPIVAFTVHGGAPPGFAAMAIRSFFLVGPNDPTVVTVAWTLFHEIAFYAVFAMWIASWRLGVAVSAVWLALIATGLAGTSVVAAYLQSPLNLLFACGVLAAYLSRSQVVLPLWAAWLAALAFVGVGMENVYAPVLPDALRVLLYGATSAVWLVGMVGNERRRDMRVPRIFGILGAASYSIYLVHYPVLSLLGKVAVATGLRSTVDARVSFVVVVALAVLAGCAFHYAVERPLLRRLSRAVGRRSPRAAPAG